MIAADDLARTLSAIRTRKPLVHSITNTVVANFNANALLALGASPAMVEAIDEVAEFTPRADALVINLGTLSPSRAEAMRLAAASAASSGRPWVLDPVAVGALANRMRLALDLLRHGPAAIRGNASEILSMAGEAGLSRGVDSAASSDAALSAAQALALGAGCVIAVTGATDYITDGRQVVAVANGHPLMTRVTGMGCSATAIIGACLAVEPDALAAVAHGLALTGIAGEIAAERCRGPGSLLVEFLDALHGLDQETLAQRLRAKAN